MEKLPCEKSGCKYRKSEENEFCVKETELLGKKVCGNYNKRGCITQLDVDYKFVACSDCLLKEREKDKAKRELAKQKLENVIESDATTKTCTVCCKELPMEEFQGERSFMLITKTCKSCRNSNKINDKKRDKEHRNELARICAKKPENIIVKQQWAEANYAKVAENWMNYRGRKIEENQEEYLKKNAEHAKSWREKNPEKVKENNIAKMKNVNSQYKIYIRSAGDKNLVFDLPQEIYTEKIKEPCHYCGETDEHKGFNGIDRMNQQIGYIVDNCVSCCQMCNYMKGSLNRMTFLRRAEHILVYNKLVEGNLHPDCFADHLHVNYKPYLNRAKEKGWEFAVTKSEFYQITSRDCYICGKKSDKTHTNGMDRFDNTLPYVLENIKPCCGECNYMKNNYVYSDVIEKFRKIYTKNMDKITQFHNLNQQRIQSAPADLYSSVSMTDKEMNPSPEGRIQILSGLNAQSASSSSIITTHDMSVLNEQRYKENNYTEKEEEKKEEYDPSNEEDRQKNYREQNRLSNRSRQQLFREKQIEIHGINHIREKNREKVEASRINNIANEANNNIVGSNKKTVDEKKEQARLRKQKQRELQKEKYGDEEYKRMNAEEVANNRAKKKETFEK